MTRRSSVVVEPEDIQRLEHLARTLGYLQTRGPGKALQTGSISALLRAIARGDVELVMRQKQPAPIPAQMRDVDDTISSS